MSRREEILAERRMLKTQYRELYDQVAAILFRHDPIGINFETNTDEYEPEVGTILPRLKECHSSDDTINVVYEEFVRWFGETAEPRQRYVDPSREIWEIWQKSGAIR